MSISRRMAWSIWFIGSIFYAYQYILRVLPNIMMGDIMQKFNIDPAVFGQFSGAYYLGYCALHLPIGLMLDRFGPRPVMSGCLLLTVLGLTPLILADHWFYPILGRFMIGVGSSAAILGTFKIIRLFFKEAHFTRMLSFSVSIGLLGALYGGVPVSYLFDTYGYEAVVIFIGVLGVAMAILTYALVPDMKGPKQSSVWADVKAVLTNGRVLSVCLLAGLMVGPMEGFADAWGAEFLKQSYGLSLKTGAGLTSMIYMGMFFAPVLSYVAEKTGSYLGTIIGAGIVMLGFFMTLIFGHFSESMLYGGFFVVGICSAYQILAIYQASTYVRASLVGLTTAVANMIIMSFGYLFHSGIGYLVHTHNHLATAEAFNRAMMLLPVTLAMGIVGYAIFSARGRRHGK